MYRGFAIQMKVCSASFHGCLQQLAGVILCRSLLSRVGESVARLAVIIWTKLVVGSLILPTDVNGGKIIQQLHTSPGLSLKHRKVGDTEYICLNIDVY